MAKVAGYWSDLVGIKFEDGTNATWIQAMTLGKYDHPLHGEIAITPDRIKQFADNVNNNIRTQQLDIDYEHKATSGEAAGWVKQAEARTNGLWLLVEWTTKAAQLIKEKAYRYFSPEFVDEWTHPKSGTTFKDVLFGGGITNRPFLKDILPINMSEFFANAGNQPTNQEGKIMTPEQIKTLAEKLGIDPASPADTVYAKLQEHFAEDDKEEEDDKKEKTEPITPEATSLSEGLKKLAEGNPAVAALMEVTNAQGRQLEEMSKRLRDQDISATVKNLQETFTKKGVALAPAVLNDLTKALSESPSVMLSETIIKAFTSLADTKVVTLGEQGAGRNGEKNETSPVAMFNLEVKKLRAEDKSMTFAEAALQLSAHNPELFEAYRSASYAG